MAERKPQIPKGYAELSKQATAGLDNLYTMDDLQGSGGESQLPPSVDQYAAQISQAIRGAEEVYQTASGDDKDKAYADLVQLAQVASRYQSEWRDKQQNIQSGLQQARADEMQNIASGGYVAQSPTREYPSFPTALPAYIPKEIDQAATKENFKAAAAQAFDVDPDQIDVDTGLPASDRIVMGVMPDDVDRYRLMANKYPNSVIPFIDNGKQDFLINKDGKLIKADELGKEGFKDALDIYSSGSTEVLPLAGSVAAASGGVGAPVTAGALATVGYSATGALQDYAIRKTFGLPTRKGDIAKSRGLEAAQALPIDMVLLGSGKFLSRRFFGKPIANEMLNQLESSQRILAREGTKTAIPAGVRVGGTAGMRAQQALAQRFPSKKVGQGLDRNMEQLEHLISGIQGNADPARVAQSTLTSIQKEIDGLAKMAGKMDSRAERVVSRNLKKRLADVQQRRVRQSKLGNTIHRELEQARVIQNEITDAAYRGVYQAADNAGYNVSYDKAIDYVKRSMNALEGDFKVTDKSAMLGFIGRLKSMQKAAAKGGDAPKFLTFRDMKNLKDELSAAGASGDIAGKAPATRYAGLVAEEYSKYVDEMASDAGILDLWQNANREFKEKSLAFKRSAPGAILKEKFGGTMMTPKKIAKRAISDPQAASDVLESLAKSVDAAGNPVAPVVRADLQSAYLDEVGLTRRSGVAPKPVAYDDEMLAVLWGADGGKQLGRKIDKLNNAFAAKKVKLGNLSNEDIGVLNKALGEKQTDEVISNLLRKSEIESEAQRLTDSSIIKLGLKQNWEEVNTGALASAAISPNTTHADMLKVWRKMPPAEQKIMAQDFAAELLNTYTKQGKSEMRRAPFIALPDAEAFLRDIGRMAGSKPTQEGRQLLQKMNTVMGKRQSDKFVAMMDMINASYVDPVTVRGGEFRAVVGLGGVSAYLAEGLDSFVHNRLMAAAFGRNSLEPFINILARDMGPEATERAFKRMVKATLTTKSGIDNLRQQMARDPDFAAQMTQLMSDMRASEVDEKR